MMQDSSGDAGESLGDIHFCSWMSKELKKKVIFKHQQTISDKESRYVLVVGELHSRPVTLLVSYYYNFWSLSSNFFFETG